MRYTVDRFEENMALLEPSEGALDLREVPRRMLPAEAREGDILLEENGIWRVDAEATAARREHMRRRFSAPGRPG